IVIPQFTNASQDARKNSLTSQLQTIRSQIELYNLLHQDNLPNVLPHSSPTRRSSDLTDQYGTVTSSGSFGPYLQQTPLNSLNQKREMIKGEGAASPTGATTGWVYDYGTTTNPGTGKFWATGTVTTMYFDEATGNDKAT